jgi:CcmD family protein
VPTSNWSFVIAAYTITWIVLFGYLFRLQRALAKKRAEYERETSGGGAQK